MMQTFSANCKNLQTMAHKPGKTLTIITTKKNHYDNKITAFNYTSYTKRIADVVV